MTSLIIFLFYIFIKVGGFDMKTFYLLIFIGFLMNMGPQLTGVLLPLLAKDLGAGMQTLAIISSIMPFAALFSRWLPSPILRRVNRKIVFIVAQFMMGSSMIICSITNNIPLLIFARILHGVSLTFTSSLTLSMVYESVTEKQRAQAVSLYSLVEVAPMTIGSVIGLKLSSLFGNQFVFMLGGIMLMASAVLSCGLDNVQKEYKKEKNFDINNYIAIEAIKPAAIIMLIYIVYSSISLYCLLYFESLGITDTSLYFLIQSVSLLFSKLLVNNKFEEKTINKLFVLSIVIQIISFILLATKNWRLIIISAVLSGLGKGISLPLAQVRCLNNVEDDKKDIASVTCYLGIDIGASVGPLLAGLVYSYLGYSYTYLVMGLVLILALFL